MARPGRNDPCPCGSGKKYKKCCLDKDAAGASVAGAVMDDLHEQLQGQEFASLEEVQALAEQFMAERNARVSDDFHGLSPEQMHRFLHFPLASPGLIEFAETLPETPDAPVLGLFAMMIEAMADKGLKATATGNLPLAFCRRAYDLYREACSPLYRRVGIRSETDFMELNVLRLIGQDMGLVRKYKGHFITSKKCRELINKEGLPGLYLALFRHYVTRYNWGYTDGFEELGIIQQSFVFSLYLLCLYGDQWRLQTFYEDQFLRAFPAALHEVEPRTWGGEERTLRRCYSLRCLENFMLFFGLVEVGEAEEGRGTFRDPWLLRATPLAAQLVRFPGLKGA